MTRHSAERVRSKRWSPVVWLLTVASLLAGHVAGAQEAKPFQQLLPAGTLVYLSFRNPSQGEEFRQSAIYRIAQDPEMKAFLADLKDQYPRLRDLLFARGPAAPALIEELASQELSVGFTGVQVAEVPEPGLVLSAVLREPSAESEVRLLSALRRAAGGNLGDPQPAFEHNGVAVKSLTLPKVVLFYGFLGPRLIVTVGPATMRSVLDRASERGASLTDDPIFQKVMGRKGDADAVLSGYANVEGILKQFGSGIPPRVNAVLQSLGADRVRAVGLGSRFSDGGIRDWLYVFAPGERAGILPAAGRPADLSLLSCVPQNARTASLFRMDLEQLYQATMRAVAALSPEAFQNVARTVARAEQRFGFRLREDLIASLGTQYLFFQAPYETVLMVEVKDRPKLESCIAGLVKAADGKAVLRQMAYEDAPIRHLCIEGAPAPLAPSYTYYKQFVVIGLYPQTLKGFLSRVKRGGPSILDSEDFKRVAGKFLAGCDAIGYQDIAAGLTDFYSLLTMAAPMLYRVKAVTIHPELLPPPSVIQAHMFGMGSGAINDQDGILYESFSPVGSAGSLLAVVGPTRSMLGVTGPSLPMTAMMAGMLMPALASARGKAQKAVCMNNLRQMAIGVAMYMNDHDGEMPQKLGDLWEYMPERQIFVCPRDQNPVVIGRPGDEDLRCSYRYVGRLAAQPDPGRTIIIYEKAGNHPDGRNAAFYDGHVEGIPEDAFRARLQEGLNLVKQANWGGYTPERQKEIEAFYAGEPAE